jgi:hypothetical protein
MRISCASTPAETTAETTADYIRTAVTLISAGALIAAT